MTPSWKRLDTDGKTVWRNGLFDVRREPQHLSDSQMDWAVYDNVRNVKTGSYESLQDAVLVVEQRVGEVTSAPVTLSDVELRLLEEAVSVRASQSTPGMRDQFFELGEKLTLERIRRRPDTGQKAVGQS